MPHDLTAWQLLSKLRLSIKQLRRYTPIPNPWAESLIGYPCFRFMDYCFEKISDIVKSVHFS